MERFLGVRGFGAKDLLKTREAGEVREAALEQNSITNRIENAKRDIARVRVRGIYNRVFQEDATKDLVRAEEALGSLLGTAQQAGATRLAAAHLQESSKVRSGDSRRDTLREAQNMQSIVLDEIKNAIRFLQRWSTYSEVIRKTREILQEQEKINRGLQGKGDEEEEKKEDEERKKRKDP